MLESKLRGLLPKIKDKKILVIGDLMLDEHIWSKVTRISPEAPVVIADVQNISHVPGGCGNVAANISALGGRPLLVGLIGRDSSGDKLINALKKLKVPTNLLIRSNDRPTILKSRVIAGSQQVVRVDREVRTLIPYRLSRKIFESALRNIPKVDAVIISDYAKGIISEKECLEIIKAAKRFKKPVLVDPKGSDYKKYRGATMITPNLSEAEKASGIKIEDETALKKAGHKILKAADSDHILITRGESGMALFSKPSDLTYIPGIKREVFDITGAGDTVIAALALAVSCGIETHDACFLANIAGSIKVSKIATQPVYYSEIEEFLTEKEPASRKIKTRSELQKIIKELKDEGLKIIFTNGCFDVLHLGHVRYLKEAKKLGEVLILGLNSDSSVRKLKGPARPYVSEHERAEILASLESIDFVTIFKELKPDNLIRLIKPDIHVKGGDYKVSELPERKLVESLGGKVMVIPPTEGKSTSSLIDRILGRNK